MTRRPSRYPLALALLLLSALFAFWFRDDKHLLASMLVFSLPPLLMGIWVLIAGSTAAFWSGVLGLLWFCHGVMVAWSRRAEGPYAWAEIVLAIAIIIAASWPGLQARFAKRSAVPPA